MFIHRFCLYMGSMERVKYVNQHRIVFAIVLKLLKTLLHIILSLFFLYQGYSRSTIGYAVFDKGTNYCNLHNLVVGSGLTNTTRYGYKEDTDNSKCTEYSSADCDKY